ncbi:MAG TPA: hypothetical protein VME67_13075 [Mycobacterium sp.]|nr:hypothetical protein [Mycobacterium sp.]HTX95690.1 hypothetical protein [Mycobacterium sp.]
MEPFTLHLPWWPILRLFSRNPLVRKVGRVEAVFMLEAVVVALLAAPFVAAAVGTAVHDARGHLYAEQAETRQAITTTASDVHTTGAEPAPPQGVIIAPARPVISRTAHSGAVDTAPTVQIGDRVGIWVDGDAQRGDESAALSRAANDAVVAALVTWVIVVAAAAGLLTVGRVMLNRIRNTGWQHDIDNLLCRGGGQTNTHP